VVGRDVQRNSICVIACGNPLMGNDGAGLEVMRLLEEHGCPGIDLIEGGAGGLGLLPLMEGYEKVVIVDAMAGIADRVGEVRVFETPPRMQPTACALHEIGVGDAVALARELGYRSAIVTVGIEVGVITSFCREIDPPVEQGIREAYDCITNMVRKWVGQANNPE
jgi:hydrogenase maturation protease